MICSGFGQGEGSAVGHELISSAIVREVARGEATPISHPIGNSGQKEVISEELDNSHLATSIGASGGLILIWHNSVKVSVKSFSPGHIDALVCFDESDVWHFTGFYGNLNSFLRHFSWDLIRRLGSMAEFSNLPWLMGGDFNEILMQSEKLGGWNVESEDGARRVPSRAQPQLQFEEIWLREEERKKVVYDAWVGDPILKSDSASRDDLKQASGLEC
ncbi:conserved hypothetical protein [Ricinus communis]|uniref:Endonuclease/exonuclease/phosphatase domain-containing protein n=1 Tax=Ricinus communis TaxID=3988 RepID=B9REM1_RICCO|nr:conserved hypothetical protein [Ricinus communis]